MNVAVTGSLGTGKSTVSKILAAALGTELIDTDQICRQQMEPGAEGFEKFCHAFGQRYLQKDGKIDRVLLRQETFADGELKKKLEDILHPIVRLQVAARSRLLADRRKILIVEVPLLFEVGWQEDFAACVVVYVPEKLSVQRVRVRDGMSAELIRQILHTQIPIEKKLAYGDFIVDNSGTMVSTVQQIAWLAKTLRRELKEGVFNKSQPKKLDSTDPKTYKRNDDSESHIPIIV